MNELKRNMIKFIIKKYFPNDTLKALKASDEIADALKININTVRSRLKRAREKLLSIKKEVMKLGILMHLSKYLLGLKHWEELSM